jgi:TolA-binding protein
VESKDAPIPDSLREEGFRIMWELHMEREEYREAMAICDIFSKRFPESQFAGNAFIGMARILEDEGKPAEAVAALRRILGLPKSLAKAEAQWRIAQIAEAKGSPVEGRTINEQSVKEYRICARKYPESEFAGPALGKIVDYHIETGDYRAANELLEQIFLDYRHEDFLAPMLMKWAILAYRTGDRNKARDKCRQIVLEFPNTAEAKEAIRLLKRLEGMEGAHKRVAFLPLS